jgi:hypothetical protein
VVERKLAGGTGYTPVQTLTGTGSFTTKSFSFADDVSALPNQTVQYRIAMRIGSDTTFYLDSATVNHSASCNAIEKIAIGPNPVNTPNLTVNIVRTVAVDVQLVLHNTAGQQLYTVKAQQAAGGGTYSIPMRQLPRGVYYITVYINGEKAVVKKVVK